MLLGIIILDDYTTKYINITPKANHDVKYFIINTLQNNIFSSLNRTRKDFIISVLWHFLSIIGRINFSQLGRQKNGISHD